MVLFLKKHNHHWLKTALVILALIVTVAASPLGAGIRGKIQCFTETGNCVEGWNGVDVNLYSDAGSTSKFSVEGSTGATIVGDSSTGSLTLEGVAFSGPVVFGAESNVISGALIAHGLGTTPTAIILTPFYSTSSGEFTQTLSISATNATSFTVNISPGAVTTITTVYWMAGR